MSLTTKTFAELFTYTRGSGATRVNAAGLIVGVDFSSTSNTIATGSKTFTLTADSSVNRDWPVGSSIRAVDQVGGGTMTGTVTSYTPSTQQLVINVASITGSGTGTDWRIGSLEFRRDFDPVTLAPKGGLVEGGVTNLRRDTESLTVGLVRLSNATVSQNTTPSPNVSVGGIRIVEQTGTFGRFRGGAWFTNSRNQNSVSYTVSCFVKSAGANFARISLDNDTNGAGAQIDFSNGNVTTFSAATVSFLVGYAIPFPNGWWRLVLNTNVSTQDFPRITGSLTGDTSVVVGNGVDGILAWGLQIELGLTLSSYIPATNVSVTRAADLLNVDGANFSKFYNPSQGTLVVELTPLAQAVGAVAGSLNDGTLNNAVRIQQKQSGTLSSIRKMATDGVTDLMALNASTGNTLRSNGVDYTEVATQSANAQFGVATSGLGKFLSVGTTESFRNSADSGLTYNARTIGGTFGGAHFGIGRFVLAGSTSVINGATVGSVIVSADGLAVRRVNIPGLTQQLNEVTSNGTNQYVAVGAGGVIYTSPDAESWTAQTSGVATDFNAVDFGGGTYVAVNATAANSRYSTNGTTWTAITGLTGTMTDVKWTGSQWVAVNTIGGVFTSADGITFAAVSTTGISPEFTSAQGITFGTVSGTGYYVIVGNGGQVAVCTAAAGASPATWVTYTNGGSPSTGTTAQLNEVLLFGTKFYIVGATQTVVEFDPVGVTFTSRTANVISTLNGLASNGSRLLICGTSGGITSTDDGTTYASRTGNATQLNGAAFGAGTYVVVGNAANGSGLIATVDPVTFAYTRRVSNTTQSVNDVLFNSTRFIAGANASVITYSDNNGATWTAVTIGGTAFNIQRIVANGNTLIAVGSGGRYSISTDNGTTWAASALNGVTTQQLNGAGFFGGTYVIAGNAGTIITTTNGTTYTLRTSGTTANLYAVNYSTRDARWYAAGDNGVILSALDPTGAWESIANDAATPVISGGVVQANPLLSNLIPGATNKVAMRIKANDFAASVNGADAVTDTSGSLPSVNRLSIGMNGASGQHFNGHIRKIAYYPSTKTDAELKGLST